MTAAAAAHSSPTAVGPGVDTLHDEDGLVLFAEDGQPLLAEADPGHVASSARVAAVAWSSSTVSSP